MEGESRRTTTRLDDCFRNSDAVTAGRKEPEERDAGLGPAHGAEPRGPSENAGPWGRGDGGQCDDGGAGKWPVPELTGSRNRPSHRPPSSRRAHTSGAPSAPGTVPHPGRWCGRPVVCTSRRTAPRGCGGGRGRGAGPGAWPLVAAARWGRGRTPGRRKHSTGGRSATDRLRAKDARVEHFDLALHGGVCFRRPARV